LVSHSAHFARRSLTSFSSRVTAAFKRQPKKLRIIRQPRKIYQTENDKNFRIDIDLATCVHGYLSPSKKQPASLIVLGVQFVCLTKRGTFNRIKLDLDFQAEDGNRPSIIEHAPFVQEEHEKESHKKVRKTAKTEFDAHTDIDLRAGHSGTSVKTEEKKESSFTENYYGKGVSSTRAEEDGSRPGIWWNVKKSSDPDSKDDAGIESNYRFAVLLTRKNRERFNARMKLLVDAGWRFRAENRLSQVKYIKGQSPNLAFSPQIWYEGNCKGINRKRLGNFVKDGKLAKLTTMPR
jgi:hypothetical protein